MEARIGKYSVMYPEIVDCKRRLTNKECQKYKLYYQPGELYIWQKNTSNSFGNYLVIMTDILKNVTEKEQKFIYKSYYRVTPVEHGQYDPIISKIVLMCLNKFYFMDDSETIIGEFLYKNENVYVYNIAAEKNGFKLKRLS